MLNEYELEAAQWRTVLLAERQKLAVQQFATALTGFMAKLAQQLLPIIEQVGEAALKIEAVLWDRYTEVGKPYGDTKEGMWQWAKEQDWHVG